MIDSALPSTTTAAPPAPSRPVAQTTAWARTRTAARLFRLVALYALLCYGVVLVGLAQRGARAAGWGLAGAGAPAESALAIPALGVTVEMDALEPAVRRAALGRLAHAGIGWVRLRVDWARAEPQPGRFQWQPVADQLADIAAAGLQPVVLLDGSPAWARAAIDTGAQDQPLAPPADAADFATFAAAFASRFGETVRFYQVWDEPNIAPHWGNRHIDPVGYAQLLRVAAEAIRGADRDAFIVSAALAPTSDQGHLAIDEPFFVQRMLAAGASAAFDALAVQPFGFGSAPTHSRQVIDQLDFQRAAILRRTLVSAGLAQKPIWAMRFGWNVRGDSPWGTVTRAAQARYIAEARGVAAAWPWLATLGWAIDQPDAPATESIWGFALDETLLSSLAAAPTLQSAPPPWRTPLNLALAVSLCALTLGVAAYTARGLPWHKAVLHFAALPPWLEALLWGGLLVTYHYSTWPPLIGACWIGAALLIVARPQAGIWLALALLPFHFQHKDVALVDGTVAVPPATAATLVLAPALLFSLIRAARTAQGATWRTRAVANLRWSDGLAAAWLLISMLTIRNAWQGQAYARGLFEFVLVPLILYIAIRLLVRDPIGLRRALIALIAGGVLVALVGLARWVQGQGIDIDGVRRLVGVDFSPNQTALTLLRALFVGLGLALGAHGARRLSWLALVSVVAGALLLTASRGALLLGVPAGIGCALWLWLLRNDVPVAAQLRGLRRRRSIRALLVALPIVVLIALLLFEARLLNRDSVDHRLLLWQTALRLWQNFPLLGVGPGGFYWRYPAYLPLGATLEPSLRHPHNVWLELATGWGMLGLLWLMALLAGWLASTARRLPQMPAALQWPAIGLASALVAALAHAQVDAFLALPELAGWLFAALALAAAKEWVTT